MAGAGLQCEVCASTGQNCTGKLQPCPAGQDSCGTVLTEVTLVGVKILMVNKGCVTSSQCKAGLVSANFGNEVASRTAIACCVEDACRTVNFTMPPADTTLNGLHCCGCFALTTEQCLEDPIKCTGAETQCIDAVGTISAGGSPVEMVMKGCVTASMCTHLKEDFWTFAGISSNLTTDNCTEASGAGGMGPGAAGLLLPALAGLLLLKLHP
ncbi:phospholipase A2 inhibitor gamma subunit B-like isoform X5 [Pelodiscus sinensis]|uniref:phospholipase A2 inhibitor gamma subunit B-like isoform X5 n=1 Tax=Pelodiscus sinensis TaxID=13735 RepID=UPI003F6B386C